jgi:hypothetical protein
MTISVHNVDIAKSKAESGDMPEKLMVRSP